MPVGAVEKRKPDGQVASWGAVRSPFGFPSTSSRCAVVPGECELIATSSSLSMAPSVRHRKANVESVSIVIEWENARLAEAERSLRMLASLAVQLDELTRGSSLKAEIVLLFNPEAVDEPAIEAIINHVRPRSQWPACFRLLPSGNLRYYEQKNQGVKNTSGDIIVFLDSDVVPESDWLEKILVVFQKPEIGVVCGNTYVECTSFYARALALFWFFPLRTQSDELEHVSMFFANNVAFRRDVICENLFPDLETFRGQSVALSKILKSKGIPIIRHNGARVSHPPPNGPRHFINRAMCEGHDAGQRMIARRGHKFSKVAVRSLKTFRRRMGRSTHQIACGYRAVHLSRAGAVGAWGLALTYNILHLAGYLLSAVNPRIVPRYFPIR
jgi:hypothetical protein